MIVTRKDRAVWFWWCYYITISVMYLVLCDDDDYTVDYNDYDDDYDDDYT